MHDDSLNDALPAPDAPGSALELLRRVDRRYLVGCVAGLVLGAALGVPVAYALWRISGEASAASTPAPAGSFAQADERARLERAGLAALANKEYSAALESFRRAQSSNGLDARLANNICVALNDLGRYAEAANACGQALEIEPDFQLAKNNLAWAKAQLGKAGAAGPSNP